MINYIEKQKMLILTLTQGRNLLLTTVSRQNLTVKATPPSRTSIRTYLKFLYVFLNVKHSEHLS